MENKEMVLTEEMLDEIAGGLTAVEGTTHGVPNSNTVPGIKCPQCGGFIPTTIMQIITGNPIVCPHCHLKIIIERGKTSNAIEALKKVQAAQEKLENR